MPPLKKTATQSILSNSLAFAAKRRLEIFSTSAASVLMIIYLGQIFWNFSFANCKSGILAICEYD